MEPRYTVSIKLVLALALALFAVAAYQAATEPIGSGEAYLYDRFVRPTMRQTLAQELPNGDVFYTMLEKRSVGLFHVSPFSVRLPGLLFLFPFLWSVWRLMGKGWPGVAGMAVAGALAVKWHWFSTADGFGTALALQAFAWCLAGKYLTQLPSPGAFYLNLCGICLGLSIAAHLKSAGAAAAVGLLVLLVLVRQQRSIFLWTDRLLVTGAVTAFLFLVLPLSHAHAAAEKPSELSRDQAARLQKALDALRISAGRDPMRIGVSASVEPVVNFYRAQHRASTWGLADGNPAAGSFNYYLLAGHDADYVEQRHLVVIYRDADFVLGRTSPAAL